MQGRCRLILCFLTLLGCSTLGCSTSTLVSMSDGSSVTPKDASPETFPARVPSVHRSSASTCPPQRGPGQTCSSSGACSIDADCDAGTNGRCFSPYGPSGNCSPTVCSYDQCQGDSDCGPKVPCDCRPSSSASSANTCATGSNCATDGDCGPNGYCSPGQYAGSCDVPLYFCHTEHDACLDDTDCIKLGAGQACNYDSTLQRFTCGEGCVVPP